MILQEQEMVMPGHWEANLQTKLNRYIPNVVVFGAMCISALTILADFISTISSGIGILCVVTIIYQYFETLKKERVSKLGLFRL